MAGVDDFIQLPTDGSGKKVRGWYNTVGANVVYAQALVPTDIDGIVLASATGLFVGGHVAHDAVDAGNPIKIGGKADTGTPTAVADGDRVDAYFNHYGIQVVANHIENNAADAMANTMTAFAIAGSGHSPFISMVGPAVFNGTTWDRQRGNTLGTFVQGHVAHDAVDAGNPIKIGGKASNTIDIAGVADGDRVNAVFDTKGRQAVVLGSMATGVDGLSNSSTVGNIRGFDGTTSGFLGVMPMVYNGSTWDRIRSEVSQGGLMVGGSVASGAADFGNPVKIGGKAQSTPASVADTQRVNAWFDIYGRMQIGMGKAMPEADDVTETWYPWDSSTSPISNVKSIMAMGTHIYAGTSWDRVRSVDDVSTAPTAKTGIQAVGVGPGYDLKFNPTDLATAADSVIANTVDGADIVQYWVGDTTSGTYTFEVSADDAAWFAAQWVNAKTGAISSGNLTPTANDVYRVQVAGWRQVRVRTVTTLGATVTFKSSHHLGSTMPVTWRALTNARAQDVSIVDGSGNQITSFGGGTQYVEDVAFAGNGTGILVVGRRDDALSTLTPVEDDAVGLRVNARGALWVANDNTVPTTIDGAVTVSSGAITVSGTVAVSSGTVAISSGSVTADTELPTAAALADGAAATPTVPTIGTIGLVYNGTTVDRQRGTAAGGTWIQGPAAHDATIAGSPVTTGGRSSHAIPTDVSADGEAVWSWLLRSGAQMVAQAPHLPMVGTPYTLISKTVQTTTTQAGTDVWTPAGGKKICITSYQIQAGGTTSGTMQLWFGANADTTYTRGTDYAIFDGEFAPSTSLKPGVVQTGLWIAPTADYEIHLTTSAAINPLTITLWGYEF